MKYKISKRAGFKHNTDKYAYGAGILDQIPQILRYLKLADSIEIDESNMSEDAKSLIDTGFLVEVEEAVEKEKAMEEVPTKRRKIYKRLTYSREKDIVEISKHMLAENYEIIDRWVELSEDEYLEFDRTGGIANV